jgi:hypothetical protein
MKSIFFSLWWASIPYCVKEIVSLCGGEHKNRIEQCGQDLFTVFAII